LAAGVISSVFCAAASIPDGRVRQLVIFAVAACGNGGWSRLLLPAVSDWTGFAAFSNGAETLFGAQPTKLGCFWWIKKIRKSVSPPVEKSESLREFGRLISASVQNCHLSSGFDGAAEKRITIMIQSSVQSAKEPYFPSGKFMVSFLEFRLLPVVIGSMAYKQISVPKNSGKAES
jgi:hypothetical protein